MQNIEKNFIETLLNNYGNSIYNELIQIIEIDVLQVYFLCIL